MVGSLGLLFNSVELIILVNFSQVVIGYAALPLSSHAQYVLLILISIYLIRHKKCLFYLLMVVGALMLLVSQ